MNCFDFKKKNKVFEWLFMANKNYHCFLPSELNLLLNFIKVSIWVSKTEAKTIWKSKVRLAGWIPKMGSCNWERKKERIIPNTEPAIKNTHDNFISLGRAFWCWIFFSIWSITLSSKSLKGNSSRLFDISSLKKSSSFVWFSIIGKVFVCQH